MQTAFLTPPFGFALFYMKGVVPPSITMMHIYRGIIPFVILQLTRLDLHQLAGDVFYLPRRWGFID